MTSTEAKALLDTISTQINGKAGEILSIAIKPKPAGGGEAIITVDWDAFKANFATQSADRTGNIWSKTLGDITYTAKATIGAQADTVPS